MRLAGPYSAVPHRRSVAQVEVVSAADLVLLANWDLPVNPRYPLTGLAGLAGVAGWGVAELAARRPRWRNGVLVVFALISVAGILGATVRVVIEPRKNSSRTVVAETEGRYRSARRTKRST